MTQETIDLIIKWFEHIQQMATDRKTQTGAVMDAQHCLNEIAAIASDSKQFVKEYQYEQEPLNKKKLNELVNSIMKSTPKSIYKNNTGCHTYQVHEDNVEISIRKAIIAGYKLAMEDKQ